MKINLDLKKLAKQRWYFILVAVIFLLAFWLRLFPASYSELGPELDTLYIYRISEYVVTHNFQLPEPDLFRHYPFGSHPRIEEFPLPFYLPALIYIVSGLDMSYLEFAIIFPALMGALAVIVMFFIGKELYNYKAGFFAAVFLASIPAFLTRTTAGWFDKEASFGVLMLLSIYFFIIAYKKNSWKLGILCGIAIGLSGMSSTMVNYMYMFYSLTAMVLLLLDKSRNLLKSYVPAAIVGTLVPFLSLHAIFGGTFSMVFLGMSVLIILRYAVERFRIIKENNLKYFVPGLVVLALIGLLVGSMFSDYFVGSANEIMEFITLQQKDPIGFTVAEHSPGNWDAMAQQAGTSLSNNVIPQLNVISPYLSIWVFMWLGILVSFYILYKNKEIVWIFPFMWLIASAYSVFFQIRFLFLFAQPASLFAGLFLGWVIDKSFLVKTISDPKKTQILFRISGGVFLLLTLYFVISNTMLGMTFGVIAITFFLLDYLIKKRESESIFRRLYERIIKRHKYEKIDFILAPVVMILALTVLVNIANGYIYANSITPSTCFPNPDILIEGQKCLDINRDNTYTLAKGQPWYDAMDFLATQTPEESNILSWWDFGYLFQTRGKRPTVSDGGQGPRKATADWYTASTDRWKEFEPWLKDTYGVDYIVQDYTLPGKYGAISAIATGGQGTVGFLEFSRQPSNAFTRENKTIYEFTNGPYILWLTIQGNSIVEPPVFLFSENGQITGQSYINDLCTADRGILHLSDKTPDLGGCISIMPYGIFYIPKAAENTIFASLMFMEGYGLPVEKVFDNQLIQIYKVTYEGNESIG